MISRGPRAAMAPLTARFSSSALLVSPWKALACPPAFLMRPVVSSAELASKSIAATGEPFLASASAMARPMPEPAPVTMAILLSGAIELESPSPCHFPIGESGLPPLSLSPRLVARGERLSSNGDPLPVGERGSRAHPLSRARVRVSDGQGVAVAAWVGAGHQRTGFRITRDTLSAAHHPGPVVDHVHLVPALSEALPRRLGNARLRVEEAVAVDTDARLLDGFLDVEAELERVQEHLRLRLQDAVGARRAHAQRESALLEDLDG